MKKRIFSALSLLGAVAMLAVGCQKEDLAGLENNEANVIYAAAPTTTPMSKVTLTEGKESGVDVKWEVGDTISLYTKKGWDGDYYANMRCTSVRQDGTAAFTLIPTDDIPELVTGSYLAIYPATNSAKYNDAKEEPVPAVQNGDDMSQLKRTCLLTGSIYYQSDYENEAMKFQHARAMMTFTFTSPDHTPAKLIFDYGGVETYTVAFTDAFKPDKNDLYTTSIMVNTNQTSTERTFIYKLYEEGEDTPYDIRTVNSTRNYISGTRYIANLDDLLAGGKANPYLISCALDLRSIPDAVAHGQSFEGKYFKMTKNIDLGAVDFTPIGSASAPFKGNFDGGNFSVKGLYIDQSDKSFQGFFGYVENATIANLTVEGTVTGNLQTGGVVGYAKAAVISNCSNEATIGGYNDIGGVVGAAEGATTIINCSNTGAINASGVGVGGVVGDADGQPVVNCYNQGDVDGYSNVGGVAGKGECTACYNTGDVSGTGYVGGVVGAGSVTDCFQLAGCVKSGSGGVNGAEKSEDYMKGLDFVTDLDSGAASYNEGKNAAAPAACGWKYNAGAYPTLDYTKVPAAMY